MGKPNRSLRGLKPFTAKNTARLIRVCDVVREGLGMGMLGPEFDFPIEDENELLASAYIYEAGWRCKIIFYPYFFRQPLCEQLVTVVHEHIHLMTHPLEQAIGRYRNSLPAAAERDRLGETLTIAREIMADHATLSIYKLLEPSILEVL